MLKKYFIRGAHRRSIGSVMTGYSDSSGSDAPAKEADREQNSHAVRRKRVAACGSLRIKHAT